MIINSCLFYTKRADDQDYSLVIGSASIASGSLMTVTSLLSTRTKVSLPHLGQYSGKFIIIVSTLTFIRVLPEQTGQSNQSVIINDTPPLP